MAQQTDEHTVERKFEQLLANNREPKVCELRTALLAASTQSAQGNEEATAFMRTRVSGPSLALMAFCDLHRMYKAHDTKCEVRPRAPGAAAIAGGLLAKGGLFATTCIEPGEVITEWDVHAIVSDMCNDKEPTLYLDPRITEQAQLEEIGATEEQLADEGLTLRFDDTRLIYFPLALSTSPYRLAHFANDTGVCPDPASPTYESSQLVDYYDTADDANAVAVCRLGFSAALVSRRSLKPGDEIIVHWGAKHWENLRRLHQKGLELVVMKQEQAQPPTIDAAANVEQNEQKEQKEEEEETPPGDGPEVAGLLQAEAAAAAAGGREEEPPRLLMAQ